MRRPLSRARLRRAFLEIASLRSTAPCRKRRRPSKR